MNFWGFCKFLAHEKSVRDWNSVAYNYVNYIAGAEIRSRCSLILKLSTSLLDINVKES